MPSDNEHLVRRLLDAFNERRFDEYTAGFSSDVVVSYPQSGERITGVDNLRGMLEAFPSAPRFTVTNTRECGNDLIVEADGDYGGGAPWKVVIMYSIEAGKLTADTAYFGAPFDPAEWRAPSTS